MVTFTYDFSDSEESGSEKPQFGNDLSKNELKNAVEEYSQWYVNNFEELSEVDLSNVTFKISTKSKRSAGMAGHHGNIEDLTLKMAWKAYQNWGWNDDWTDTIEHELIHIWQFQVHGDANHGKTFKQKAREIDAPRHCPKFSEFKYEFYCEKCGELTGGRYKKSKAVKNPEGVRSGCCKADVRVEINENYN